MAQLDEQLEEIGLECLTARWLADFLEIPRGRVYRAVQLMGAESIGHTGRAAIYDADTIIGLASFLYGQGRFSSHTGRLPKGGLERLKRQLDGAAVARLLRAPRYRTSLLGIQIPM